MPKKEMPVFWQRLWENFTQLPYFRAAQISRKSLQVLLQENNFRGRLMGLLPNEQYDCREILDICRPVMAQLCEEPQGGWLPCLYDHLVERLYPSDPPLEQPVWFARGGLFYLTVLRTFLQQEMLSGPFDPMTHFQYATPEEYERSPTAQQYTVFLRRMDEYFVTDYCAIIGLNQKDLENQGILA